MLTKTAKRLLAISDQALAITTAGIGTPDLRGTEAHQRMRYAWMEAHRDVQRTRQELKKEAEYLARKMNELARDVSQHHTINSLGEVQGRGLEVDRLCALLHEREQQFQAIHALTCTVLGVPVSLPDTAAA